MAHDQPHLGERTRRIVVSLLRRLALSVHELQSPTIGVTEIDRRPSGGGHEVRRPWHVDALAFEGLVGLLRIINPERNVIDADILLAADLMNFKNRLVRTGELHLR